MEKMENERTIPVREEVLQVHKHFLEIGEVIIQKKVITEEKTITVPVTREELVIERLPATPQSSGQPEQESKTREDALKVGQTLRVVLHEEQVRIEKYPVVKEEVFISKRQIQETKSISDTLKREVVHIERIGNVQVQEKDGK